jgi:enoyl-CoA hydratase/carnithine racemase
MTQSSTVVLERLSLHIAKVTFSNPPVNLIAPDTVLRMRDIVVALSNDPDIKVVLFTSSLAGFFINHFDLSHATEFPILPGAEASPAWTDLVLRLTDAPFISIGSIRGRTRGGGNELALALDLRYASREKAIFGQPEVGTGILPGGGGSERLPRFVRRDRALEAILSSDDYDAILAEKWGWVTRALPDAELDGFVERLATRLASFDRQVLAAAKAQINRASLPPHADLLAAYSEYVGSLAWPSFKAGTLALRRRVAEKGIVEIELNLGDYIGGAKG